MQEEAVAAAQDTLYRAILYAYCPLHIAVLCGLCHLLRCACLGAQPAA